MTTTSKHTAIDPEDLLSDSLQTLYDYTPITHSSAGLVFQYTISPELLKCLSQSSTPTPSTLTLTTPTTQAENWSLHASSIWASSLFVADHIHDLHLDRHIDAAHSRGQTPLRLLELGAGAGLPGILIAKVIEGVDVTVSDYPDRELIGALKHNIEVNDVGGRCRAVPYAWGSHPVAFRRTDASQIPSVGNDCAFDVILAADTLWNSELHHLFLQALRSTLRKRPDARIYLVAGLHTGRYTLQAFMNAVSQYGLEFEEITERRVGSSGSRPWGVERHDAEDDRERRKWVIWMVMRWVST